MSVSNAEMREPIELAFGDQRFKIAPLTVDQVCSLETLFAGDVKLSPLHQARKPRGSRSARIMVTSTFPSSESAPENLQRCCLGSLLSPGSGKLRRGKLRRRPDARPALARHQRPPCHGGIRPGDAGWENAMDRCARLVCVLAPQPARSRTCSRLSRLQVPPDEMTVSDFHSMEPPPGHLSISELKRRAAEGQTDPSGIGALVAMFPSGFVPANR